mmetsp:Transcript_1129/g.2272  ORF Transcript_1129/g.2272 Transcript_1129/m.2272 type:complete len:152 (-) Transcript_1129:2464-2919(-)
MSSKIVRKLLRASASATEQSVSDQGRETYDAQHSSAVEKNVSVPPVTTNEAIDLQVRYMLSIDQSDDSNPSTPKKKRPKKQDTTKGKGIDAIVTNTRGSAALAKRVISRTSNKRKYKAKKKEEYFQKIARQLSKDDVKKAKKKKSRVVSNM